MVKNTTPLDHCVKVRGLRAADHAKKLLREGALLFFVQERGGSGRNGRSIIADKFTRALVVEAVVCAQDHLLVGVAVALLHRLAGRVLQCHECHHCSSCRKRSPRVREHYVGDLNHLHVSHGALVHQHHTFPAWACEYPAMDLHIVHRRLSPGVARSILPQSGVVRRPRVQASPESNP